MSGKEAETTNHTHIDTDTGRQNKNKLTRNTQKVESKSAKSLKQKNSVLEVHLSRYYYN